MGWNVYRFGRKDHHRSEADEFFDAAEMARQGVEKMHELAEEMEDRYSSRFYGMRHDGYGMREYYPMHDGYGYGMRDWDDEMMHERRRRDGRGRYM